MDSNGAPVFLDGSAKFFEGQLSVIPSSRRLRDAGHAIGKKSSEQNCGFYLRTGHGHFVIDGLETDSANFERRKIIVARANVCAHIPQRTDDALHGSFLQRVVTCELRCKLLSGQNSRQQPHGRPGIFGVERAPTALQAAQRSEEHTSELQSLAYLVCRLLLEKKKKRIALNNHHDRSVIAGVKQMN